MLELFFYTVDEDQNLYYCTSSYSDPGTTLYKRSEKGKELYCVPIENEVFPTTFVLGHHNMALDGNGKVYHLTRQTLLQIDSKGTLTGKMPFKDNPNHYSLSRYLLSCGGHDYFLEDAALMREAYEITGTGTFVQKEVPALIPADFGSSRLYQGPGGILMSSSTGHLRQYFPETDSVEDILYWEDSDIYGSVHSEPDRAAPLRTAIALLVCNFDGKMM